MTIKKTFIILVITFLIFSCSKSESEIIPEPVTDFEKLLDEYGLFNSKYGIEGVCDGENDTSRIYFNGRDNGKLYFACYDQLEKTKLFSWISPNLLDTIVQYDAGYGNISEKRIKEYKLTQVIANDNGYAFILDGLEIGDWAITTDLYFISNSGFVKKKSFFFSPTNYWFEEIIPWFDNTIYTLKDNGSGDGRKALIFSMQGEELLALEDFEKPYKYFCPISLREYIKYTSSLNGGKLIRKRLDEETPIWIGGNPLADLPSNTKIDNAITYLENDQHAIFEFYYTQISGEKGVRKVRINNENGEFEII